MSMKPIISYHRIIPAVLSLLALEPFLLIPHLISEGGYLKIVFFIKLSVPLVVHFFICLKYKLYLIILCTDCDRDGWLSR
jgi:hypothetical protein